jgi:hypothetical protein
MLLKELLTEQAASPKNVDGEFTVGKVKFDNRKGLGSTPDNANVEYKGLVAWMTPSKFRQLALAADRSDTAGDLEKMMLSGEAIGTPTLYCDFDGDVEEPGEIKVKSHEGRARSDAFKAINGNIPMPVQLHFYGGIRARMLSEDFIKTLHKQGLLPERGVSGITKTIIPDGPYFWNGQTVSV